MSFIYCRSFVALCVCFRAKGKRPLRVFWWWWWCLLSLVVCSLSLSPRVCPKDRGEGSHLCFLLRETFETIERSFTFRLGYSANQIGKSFVTFDVKGRPRRSKKHHHGIDRATLVPEPSDRSDATTGDRPRSKRHRGGPNRFSRSVSRAQTAGQRKRRGADEKKAKRRNNKKFPSQKF